MKFEVVKTPFGNALGEHDGKFSRQVKNKTVSYVAYFSEGGSLFRLEVVTGEQLSATEVTESEDIEAYLTSENTDVAKGLNKALFVLKEFQHQYERKIGKETTVRFVSWDRAIDEKINTFIDSTEFRVTAEPKNKSFGENVISRLLGEKKKTDEEVSRPTPSKYKTNPEAFEYGQHIKHFEDTAKGLLGNGSVVNLALGRLNDDGGDYDTVVLSGDKTPVEVLYGPTQRSSGSFDIVRKLVNMGRII